MDRNNCTSVGSIGCAPLQTYLGVVSTVRGSAYCVRNGQLRISAATGLIKYISMPTILDLASETILAILLELDVRDILACKQVRAARCITAVYILIYLCRSVGDSENSPSPARCNTSATSRSLALSTAQRATPASRNACTLSRSINSHGGLCRSRSCQPSRVLDAMLARIPSAI